MASTTVKKLKKEKEGKKGFQMSTLLFALLALILTVALFFGLIVLQNHLSEEIIYTDVIVAKADIPEGMILTMENAATYLERRQVNSLTIPRGSINDPSVIIGQRTRVELITGEMLSIKDFENLNVYLDKIMDKEPVEISIAAPAAADADGGKIRAGDLINITMMFTDEQLGKEGSSSNATLNTQDMFSYANDAIRGINEPNLQDFQEIEKENGATTYYNEKSGSIITRYDNYDSQYNFNSWAQYVMDGLYVKAVLNGDGQEISPDDRDSVVAMFIFVIPKADERDLNNILANCSGMRISKNVSVADEAKNSLIEQPAQEQPSEEETTESVPEESTEEVKEPTKEERIAAQDAELMLLGYFKITMQEDGTYLGEDGKAYSYGETEEASVFTDAEKNVYVIGVMRGTADVAEGEVPYALILDKEAFEALNGGESNEESSEANQ